MTLEHLWNYNFVSTIVLRIGLWERNTAYASDALGRESYQTTATGMRVTHGYDPTGSETMQGAFRADGTPLTLFTSAYDSVGNLTAVWEADGPLASLRQVSM